MGHFNKKHAGTIVAPAWASFFTAGQYADFSRLLTEDLQRRGLSWREDDGCAVIRRGGGSAQRVGLLNLAQMCHMDAPSRWAQLIHEFMDSTLRVDAEIEHMVDGLRDFDALRGKLKLRLYGEDYLQTAGVKDVLWRKPVDGLLSVVVCDLGFANISVPRVMAEGWNKGDDEIFDLALANVRAQEKVEHFYMPTLPGGLQMEVLEGHSNYAVTHALCLEQHLRDVSGFGVVLNIPNRHLIFLHRIVGMNVTEAISALHTVGEKAYRDGPGSVSKSFYWWRPERGLRRLDVQPTGEHLQFLADVEFQREVIAPLLRGN